MKETTANHQLAKDSSL